MTFYKTLEQSVVALRPEQINFGLTPDDDVNANADDDDNLEGSFVFTLIACGPCHTRAGCHTAVSVLNGRSTNNVSEDSMRTEGLIGVDLAL